MGYASEQEARLDFAVTCARYAGINEGGTEHEELLSLYNEATEGYDMVLSAPWCAAFLSAIAAKLGYQSFPLECSCSRMLQKAQKQGIRVHSRGFLPRVGDWLVWDLDLNGSADHIGVVIGIDGEELWVLEGNYSNTVKTRFRIRWDDPRIYRWICPDYTELVAQSPEQMEQRYPDLASVPEYARATIRMLVDRQLLLGVQADDLALSGDMLRILVILDRAGVFAREPKM